MKKLHEKVLWGKQAKRKQTMAKKCIWRVDVGGRRGWKISQTHCSSLSFTAITNLQIESEGKMSLSQTICFNHFFNGIFVKVIAQEYHRMSEGFVDLDPESHNVFTILLCFGFNWKKLNSLSPVSEENIFLIDKIMITNSASSSSSVNIVKNFTPHCTWGSCKSCVW